VISTIIYPLNLLLIIIGSFLCIRLTLYLLIKQSIKANSNKYLGILVLSLGIPLIVSMAHRFDVLEYIAPIIGPHAMGHFLVGPLTYFYVQSCTQKGFTFGTRQWIHFAPFIIEIILNIPFFMESSAFKLDFYEKFVGEGQLFSIQYLMPIKLIHGLTYFALCIRMIFQYQQHIQNTSSNSDKIFHRWLLFFVFIVALPILMLIYVAFTEFIASQRYLIFLLGYLIFYISIDIAILLKPELFQTFPNRTPQPESSEAKKQKYESSNLAEDKKEDYAHRLRNHLESKKTYRASDLSLSQLSDQIEIPAHYVSQVINEKLGTNFLDLINQYRVQDVKEQFANPDKNHYTIMSLAYDAGFNSKSTFYSAFKKHTGMTPSAYKKSQGLAQTI